MPPHDRHDLSEVSSRAYPSLERVPGKQNWVDKAGGLPSYIERIAKHLHYEKGRPIGTAIATAVATTKRWCSTGKNWNGGDLKPATQAKACKAVASWEAKRGKSKAKSAAKDVKESVDLAEVKENRELIEAHCDDRVAAEIAKLAKRRLIVAEGMMPLLRENSTVGKQGLVEAAADLLRSELHEDTKLAMVGGPAADPRQMRKVADALEAEIEEVAALAESFGGDDKEKGDGEQSDAPPWETDGPKGKKKKKGKKLTPEQKRRARERARKAGRKYPNLVDNMAAAKDVQEGLMRRGSQGPDVAKVQRQVNSMGAAVGDAGPDGKFGIHTEGGVKAVQRREGLKADGIVGPKTQAMLDAKAPDAPAPESPAPDPAPDAKKEVAVPSWETSGRRLGSRKQPKRAPAMQEGELQEDAAGDAEAATDGNTVAPADGPPNLREGSGDQVCGNCEYYEDGKCTAHGDHSVGAGQVCDDWESEMAEVMEACHQCHTDLEQGESLCPECGTAVLVETKLQEATVDNRLRGAARSAITSRWTPDMIAQIRRLPDGTFAPKGRGRVLKAGDRVRTPRGTRGRVSKDGRSITLANGEKVRLAPPSEQRKGAPEPKVDPFIAGETDREAGPRPSEFERSIGVMSPEGTASPDNGKSKRDLRDFLGKTNEEIGAALAAEMDATGPSSVSISAQQLRNYRQAVGEMELTDEQRAAMLDLPRTSPADAGEIIRKLMGGGLTERGTDRPVTRAELEADSVDGVVNRVLDRLEGTASPDKASVADTLAAQRAARAARLAEKDEANRKEFPVGTIVTATLPRIGGEDTVSGPVVDHKDGRLRIDFSDTGHGEVDVAPDRVRKGDFGRKEKPMGTASPESDGPSSGWPDALERLNDWIGLYEGPWDTEDVGRGNYAAIAPITVSDTDRGGGWAYVYPDGQVEVTDETGNQVAITASGHALDDTAVDPIGAGRKKPQEIESEAASVLSGDPPEAYESAGTASVGQDSYEDDYRRPLRLAQLSLDAVWDRGEEDGPMDRQGAAYQSALAEKALKGLSVPTDFSNSAEINDEIRKIRLDVGLVSGPEGVAQLSPDRAKELSQRIGRVVDGISEELDRNPRYLGDGEGTASVRFETVDDSNVPEFSEFVDKMDDDPGIVGQAVRSSDDSAVATDLRRAYAITAIDARRPARGGMRPRNFRSQDWFVGSVGGYLNLQGSLSGFGSRPIYPEQVTPTESIDTVIYRDGPDFGIDPTEYLPQDALDRERKRLQDENDGGVPTVNGTASPDTDLVGPDSAARNPARRDLARVAALRSKVERAGSASPDFDWDSVGTPDADQVPVEFPEIDRGTAQRTEGVVSLADIPDGGEFLDARGRRYRKMGAGPVQGSAVIQDLPEPADDRVGPGFTDLWSQSIDTIVKPYSGTGTASPDDVPEPTDSDLEAVYGPRDTWRYTEIPLDPSERGWDVGSVVMVHPPDEGGMPDKVRIVAADDAPAMADTVTVRSLYANGTEGDPYEAPVEAIETFAIPEGGYRATSVYRDWGAYSDEQVGPAYGIVNEAPGKPRYEQRAFVEYIAATNQPGNPSRFVVTIMNEAYGETTFEPSGLYYTNLADADKEARRLGHTDWSTELDKMEAPSRPEGSASVSYEDTTASDLKQGDYILDEGGIARVSIVERHAGWTEVWHDGVPSDSASPWRLYEPDYAVTRVTGLDGIDGLDEQVDRFVEQGMTPAEARKAVLRAQVSPQLGGGTASPPPSYEDELRRVILPEVATVDRELPTVEELNDRWMNGDTGDDSYGSVDEVGHAARYGRDVLVTDPYGFTEVAHFDTEEAADEFASKYEIEPIFALGTASPQAVVPGVREREAARIRRAKAQRLRQALAERSARQRLVTVAGVASVESFPLDSEEPEFVEGLDIPATDTSSLRLIYLQAEDANYHRWNERVGKELALRDGGDWYGKARTEWGDRWSEAEIPADLPKVKPEGANVIDARPEVLRGTERDTVAGTIAAQMGAQDTISTAPAGRTVVDTWGPTAVSDSAVTFLQTFDGRLRDRYGMAALPGPDRRYVKVTYQPVPDLYSVEITDVSKDGRIAPTITLDGVYADGLNDALLATPFGFDSTGTASPADIMSRAGRSQPGEWETNTPDEGADVMIDLTDDTREELEEEGAESGFSVSPNSIDGQRGRVAGPPDENDGLIPVRVEDMGRRRQDVTVFLHRTDFYEMGGTGGTAVPRRDSGTASVAPGVREREAAATRRRRANRLRVALQERQTGRRIAALGTASPSIGDYARRAADERDAKTAERARKAVARGRVYRLEPVLMDRMGGTAEVQQAIEDGTPVVLVQPPGTPRNGTMGQVYVGDARTGRFLGMVSKNSLVKLSPEERKALRDEQGTASPDFPLRTQGANGAYFDAEQRLRYAYSDSKPVTDLRVGDVIVGSDSGPWDTPGEVTAIEPYRSRVDGEELGIEVSFRGSVVQMTPNGGVIDKTWKQRWGYSVDGDQTSPGYLPPSTVQVLGGGTASPGGWRESNDPKELAARVKGFTVTGVGKDSEGHPYLSLRKGKTVRTAYVQRDPEGNGPGFLFGLPIPDSPRIQALRELSRREETPEARRQASIDLQDAWDEEYYGFLVGKKIEGVGETDDGEFEWTSLRVNAPEAGGIIELEISRDEEGNGPGWLLVDDGTVGDMDQARAGALAAATGRAMAEWPVPEPIEGSDHPARGEMGRYNTVEPRPLRDVAVGSVIRWTDFGHGPYNEDGTPDTEKGGVAEQVREGVLREFIEYNDPDGPTRFAKVVTESPDGTPTNHSVNLDELWPPSSLRDDSVPNFDDPDAPNYISFVPTIVDVLIDADLADAAEGAAIDLEAEQAEKAAEAALRRITSKSVADFVMGLPDAADAIIYRARPPYNYYFVVTPDQNASGTATAITPRGRVLDIGDNEAHVFELLNTTANEPGFQKGENRTVDALEIGPLGDKVSRIGQVRHLASRPSGGTASPAPVSPGGATRSLVQRRRNRRSMIDVRRSPRAATISSVLGGTRSVDAASPARSAKGNIRNLKAMRDEKITNLADQMVEIGRAADPEASSAIAQQLAERGIDHPIVGPLASAAANSDFNDRSWTPSGIAAILRLASKTTDDEARPTGAFPEVAEGIDSLGYSWRPGDSLDADLDLASVIDALDYYAEALRNLANGQGAAGDVAVDRRSADLAASDRKATLARVKVLDSHPIRKYSIPEDEGTASVAALQPLYLDGEAVTITDPGSPGSGKTGEIIATRTEQDGRLPLFFHTVRTADGDYEVFENALIGQDEGTASPVARSRDGGTTAKTDTLGSRSVASIDDAVDAFLSQADDRTRRDLGSTLTAFEAYDVTSLDLADPASNGLGGTAFLTDDSGSPTRITVSKRADGLYDVSSSPVTGNWTDFNDPSATTVAVHPDDLPSVVGRHTTPFGAASVDFAPGTMTSLSRRAHGGIATPNRGVSLVSSGDGMALVRRPDGAEAEFPTADAVRVAWSLDTTDAALRSDVDRAFDSFSTSGDLDSSGLGYLTGTASVTPRVVPEGYLQNTEAVELGELPDGALFALVDGSRYVKHRMTAEGAEYLIAKPVDETGRVIDLDPAYDEATSPRSHRPGSRILHFRQPPASLGGVSPDYAEKVSVKNSPARSAKGNLRNFRAMGEPKITALAEEMIGSDDTEAVSALADALDDKGLSDLASRVRGSAGSAPTTTDSLYDAIRASVERTPSVEGAADALGSDWQPDDVVRAIQQLADRGVTVNAEQTDADTLAALIRASDLEPTGAGTASVSAETARVRAAIPETLRRPTTDPQWDALRSEIQEPLDGGTPGIVTPTRVRTPWELRDSTDPEPSRSHFVRVDTAEGLTFDVTFGSEMAYTQIPEAVDYLWDLAADEVAERVRTALETGEADYEVPDLEIDHDSYIAEDPDGREVRVPAGYTATTLLLEEPTVENLRPTPPEGTASPEGLGSRLQGVADQMAQRQTESAEDAARLRAIRAVKEDYADQVDPNDLIDDPDQSTALQRRVDEWWDDLDPNEQEEYIRAEIEVQNGTASPGFDAAGNRVGEPSLDQPEGPSAVTSEQDLRDAIGDSYEAEWNAADWDLLREVVPGVDEMGGDGMDFASTTYSQDEMVTILNALKKAWEDGTTGADDAHALYRDILSSLDLFDPATR